MTSVVPSPGRMVPPANPLRLSLQTTTQTLPPSRRADYTSEIVWGVLGALALGWELYAVVTEKRTGQEPLTRLVRDRLFVMGRAGLVFRVLGLAGWVWVLVHFYAPDAFPGAWL